MKQIISITLVLVVLAVAVLGSLAIFEVVSYKSAMSNLLKIVAAVVLLGGCSALIAIVMRSDKENQD